MSQPQNQPQQPPQWPVVPPAQPGQTGSYGYRPAYQPPPSSGGSGKAIAIIVGAVVLVVLLFCGGIVGLIVWAANTVEDSISEFDTDRPGGRDNPISLAVGDAFEIDGIEYAEGWQVQPAGDATSGDSIVGLKGTNDRVDESSESVYLTFTFIADGNVEAGEISCSSDGTIGFGNAEVLDCRGSQPVEDAYDHVEVAASY